jgi:hypothetical protein
LSNITSKPSQQAKESLALESPISGMISCDVVLEVLVVSR